MPLNKFEPPTIEDIKLRFDVGGIAALTDEDVATLLGLLEAKTARLEAVRDTATGKVKHINNQARLLDILDIVE